jgi:hypothetical protein
MLTKLYGDYQTPAPLAALVVDRLAQQYPCWTRVLEPTCGTGQFLHAAAQHHPAEMVGIELQTEYAQAARANTPLDTRIIQADIFSFDLAQIDWHTPGHLLVVGNPPWVTNAAQSAAAHKNLPDKSNFQGWPGLEALTGKANFDIAETIWLKLLHALGPEPATLALLCKTSVARKVLQHVYDQRLLVSAARIYPIDSQRWFGVTASACLLALNLNLGAADYDIEVYAGLDSAPPPTHLGFARDTLVANPADFQALRFMDGRSPLEWRQGIKHDAATVLELRCENGRWLNKLGDGVVVEPELHLSAAQEFRSGRTPPTTRIDSAPAFCRAIHCRTRTRRAAFVGLS